MPSQKVELRILDAAEHVYREAAEEFVRLASQAVEKEGARGVFTVALSGGSTPKGLYHLLASGAEPFRERIPWAGVHFFWGDERHVPPDDPSSNFGMARDELLSKVPVPPGNVHRIEAENPDAGKAAEKYDRLLRDWFGLSEGQLPRFDLLLLGLGRNAHTASLFPGVTLDEKEKEKLAAAVWIEELHACRITLTPPVLNNASDVIFLVTGDDKSEPLRRVLQGRYKPDRYPAQLIRPANGRLLWLVDRAAGKRLRFPNSQ
jgi:6-phosphogluconolactonase